MVVWPLGNCEVNQKHRSGRHWICKYLHNRLACILNVLHDPSSKERAVGWCPHLEFQIALEGLRRREALIALLVVQDQAVVDRVMMLYLRWK